MPAHLHRELIGDAERWLLVTHGIYGSGANWRGIARKLVAARPDWGVVLVDLRQHGRSEPGEPPHDLGACADDVRALVDEVPGIEALAGHSFGGKVVLAARALVPPRIRQIWVLDASPSARPGAEDDPDNTVARVLALMEALPKTWAKREDFVAALVAEGHALSLAQWLAMNLVANGDAFTLRLDLGALRAMLRDYNAKDLWDVAFDARLPGEVEIVIAEKSATISEADRRRLATAPPHVHVHRIDAGHWLHIDAPANVVELLASTLPTALR